MDNFSIDNLENRYNQSGLEIICDVKDFQDPVNILTREQQEIISNSKDIPIELLENVASLPLQVQNINGSIFDIYFDYDTYTTKSFFNEKTYTDLDLQQSQESLTPKFYENSKVVVISRDIYSSEDVEEEFLGFEFETEEVDNFEDIEANNYQNESINDPTASGSDLKVREIEFSDYELEQVENLIEKSYEELQSLREDCKYAKKDEIFWSLDEVDETYNTGITTNEKKSFLIWLQQQTDKKLRGEFVNKYAPIPRLQNVEKSSSVDIIEDLINSGDLYVTKVKFNKLNESRIIYVEPKAIFIGGNLLQKKYELINSEQAFLNNKILNSSIYKNHIVLLDKKINEQKKKFLRVSTENNENNLIISPLSKFAKDFKIKEFISVTDKTKLVKSPFEKISKNDFLKSGTSTLYQLSLQKAFFIWCKEAGKGEEAVEYGIQFSLLNKSAEELRKNTLKARKGGKTIKEKDFIQRKNDDAKKTAQRLFNQFLQEGLTKSDKERLEIQWNAKYYSYAEVDIEKIPIGFTWKKWLGNSEFKLRKFNINAVRNYLLKGSIGLAYGVGIGKTFCSIFVLKQAIDLGLTDKALVLTPLQVYKQFGMEIEKALGSKYSVLGKSRLQMISNGRGEDNVKANNPVNGINLGTYSAINILNFSSPEYLSEEWIKDSCSTLNQFPQDSISPILLNQNRNLIGKFYNEQKKQKQTILIDKANYDFIIVDEVHNFNKLYGEVKSPVKCNSKSKIQREKNIFSGVFETKKPPARSINLFWLVKYIQHLNKGKWNNTCLLSATPFTNSPLEVYSMFELLNSKFLVDNGVDSLYSFYELYSNVEYSTDVTTDLKVQRKNKFVGWNNLIPLQNLLYYCFDKSSPKEEDEATERPVKFTLPLQKMTIDNKVYELSKRDKISTTIEMSELQKKTWKRIREYSEDTGKVSFQDIAKFKNTSGFSDTKTSKVSLITSKNESDGVDNINVESGDELRGKTNQDKLVVNQVKTLSCLQWGQELFLNPYFFKYSGLKNTPNAKEFIEASPKLLYTMKCIKSVKEYHEREKSIVSGQIIYLNYKVDYFYLFAEYLVNEIGFSKDEVGIITGKENRVGDKTFDDKKDVADLFNGIQIDEKGKEQKIDDSKRVKVLLGSKSIVEGINLQFYGTVMYNVFLEFLPTINVQAEGRIWRQKNNYNYVRIVYPLIENSIDIFMFQKLQDKTRRINEIWTRTGEKNVLDTTAFNPKDLKFELFTDPLPIAKMLIAEKENEINIEIEDKTPDFSNLISFQEKYNAYEKTLKYPFILKTDDIISNKHIGLYNNINQIRPDLITMPLINKQNAQKYLQEVIDKTPKIKGEIREQIESSINGMFDVKYLKYSNQFLDELNDLKIVHDTNFKNYILTDEQADNLNSVLNYSMEDLHKLMFKVIDDKKVAMPRGYSVNFRQSKSLSNRLQIGDIVNYQVNGKANKSEVLNIYNRDGENIKDVLIENQEILSILIPDLEISNENVGETLNSFFSLDESVLDISKQQEYFNLKDKLETEFVELDKVVDLVLSDENIISIERSRDLSDEDQEIMVYEWESKETRTNVIESFEYLKSFYESSEEENEESIFELLNQNTNFKRLQLNFSEKFESQLSILFGQESMFSDTIYYNNDVGSISKKYLENKRWKNILDNAELNGLFYSYNSPIFSEDTRRLYNDYIKIKFNEFPKYGIYEEYQLNELVEKKQNEIENLKIELTKIQTEEYLQTEVQNAEEKIKENRMDFERNGSSVDERVKDFANKKSNYFGNELLSYNKFTNLKEIKIEQKQEDEIDENLLAELMEAGLID